MLVLGCLLIKLMLRSIKQRVLELELKQRKQELPQIRPFDNVIWREE